ncbi:MAG: ROK family transcriptional regulator [Bifidobacteriaceae bacterium]|jgi:predicted NBD/HSP70 family sugar kinase/DNA-binding CsgD family transcriptional regulator|nr:ROK family transcriptional regulator [Bifidobacteriaceae bacterium]
MSATGPGSPAALRRANFERLLSALAAAGNRATQAELARRSGLSAASVSNLVRSLERQGQVVVSTELYQGRRSRVVARAVQAGYTFGLDLGRTHIRAGLGSFDHRLVAQEFSPMTPDTSAADGLRRCAELFQALLDRAAVTRSDIKGAAAGVPGPLSSRTGEIGAGAVLPAWTGIDLQEHFSEALGIPVVVENDANLGALGEFTWATPVTAMAPQVYTRLSVGIGCGIIIDGDRLLKGAAGTAGELGHVSLDTSGRLCRCGNRGCVETTASTPVLLETLSSAMEREVSLAEWLAMARSGHNGSIRLLEDMGRNVGAAIASLVNLLSPATVVLGGPVTAAGALLLNTVRETVTRRSMPAPARAVQVRLAKHPGLSELYGALALATSTAKTAS